MQQSQPEIQPSETPLPFRPLPRKDSNAAPDALPPEFAAPADELPEPTLPESVPVVQAPAMVKPAPRRKGCAVFWVLLTALGVGGGYYYRTQHGDAAGVVAGPGSEAPSVVQVTPVDTQALPDNDFANVDYEAALPHDSAKAPELTAEELYRCAVSLHRKAEKASYAQAVEQMPQVVQFYTRAAELGHTAAALALGACCYKGLGMPPSRAAAIKWFGIAAEQGDAEAQFRLAWCLMESTPAQDELAVQWLKRAAGQGHAAACYDLAVCFLTARGTEENVPQAAHYLQLAAEQKHPAAMRRLAFCYRDGSGTPQDIARSLELFSAAAAAGDAEAQFNYAWALHHGYGTGVNLKEALRFYLLSSAQYYAPAQSALQEFFFFRLLPEYLVDFVQKSQNYPKM